MLSLLSSHEWQEFLNYPQARRELTREYFYLFWWWYFPHYHKRRIPDYHIEVCAAARSRRLLVIEPRDHGKSVRWSCAFPLWRALTNPKDQPTIRTQGGGFLYEIGAEEIITQVSASGSLPERWIRRHKRELEFNTKLINDWGEQSTANMPDGVWTADEIVLKNGAHIYSKGCGAQIRGDHPTVVVVDDLEDRKRVKKPELRDKDKEYFFADLYGALEPHSDLVVVGTILHEESLLSQLWKYNPDQLIGSAISEEFDETWVKFRFQAMLPDGTPLAPEIWPAPALQARKATLLKHKPSVWKCEYMNEPESSENPVFPSTWFQEQFNHYDSKDPEFVKDTIPNLKIITFMDPNVGEKETNDWTALITLGYKLALRPEIYVLENLRFRGSFQGKVDKALERWQRWHGRIGFEGVQFQSVLKEVFETSCAEKNYSPDVFKTMYKDRPIKGEPVPRLNDKVSRAERIQIFFEMNCVKFDYRDPTHVSLMDELKTFPTGQFDDQVDSIVGGLWEVKSDWNMWKEREKQQAPPIVKYDETTGEPTEIIRQTSMSIIENRFAEIDEV